MAKVSSEVLAGLMTYLDNGKNIMQFINENNLKGQVRPQELRQQFVETFGQDVFRQLMQGSMFKRMTNRFNMMAKRMTDVQKVDEAISSLNDAIAIFEDRKAELQQN